MKYFISNNLHNKDNPHDYEENKYNIMTEKEKFNNLINRDPTPGVGNRIKKEGKDYLVPGWVFESEKESVLVTYKNIKSRYSEKFNLTGQIIYDILVLGITNIEDRPKCPICGKPVSYKGFAAGYSSTCGDKSCRAEYSRREMLEMWKSDLYRETQSKSHKDWALIPENKKLISSRTTEIWKDEDYRKRQTKSHKDWASIPKNKEAMSKTTSNLWKNEDYRKKQIKSHVEWARNNPDKIGYGVREEIDCSKSMINTIYCDSSWEKDFINVCLGLDFVKSIERSGLWLTYELNGQERTYFPDFIIETDTEFLIIEIKSDWKVDDESTLKKAQAGIEYANKNNFRYLMLSGDDLYSDSSRKIINIENIKNLLKNKTS